MLTAEQERALAARIGRGDPAAVAELVTANLGLRYRACVRFRGASDLSFEDLMQEAGIGLIDAARTFDPDRGRFKTHAYSAMRGALDRAIAEAGSMIRIPRHLRSLRRRLALAECIEPGLDDAALCERLKTTPARLRTARRPNLARVVPADGTRFDPTDPGPDLPSGDAEALESRGALADALDRLSPFEALVIRRRFGMPYAGAVLPPAAVRSIAISYSISIARVQRAEASALAKLRGAMMRTG